MYTSLSFYHFCDFSVRSSFVFVFRFNLSTTNNEKLSRCVFLKSAYKLTSPFSIQPYGKPKHKYILTPS